eukprot:TRINITY_DN11767_c0_g1_i2.p1 TRINITY_DN11767_c0_g1~~TRINITY_DN11767_c0_g1_i2.p1  ORF type:complete len:277 (+),score=27.45 TRINITY_DN11767_c0_g1_i2:101-931(+)
MCIRDRWYCEGVECDEGIFMGSGLDDYPRNQEQGVMSKRHLDLHCWVMKLTQTIIELKSDLIKTEIEFQHSQGAEALSNLTLYQSLLKQKKRELDEYKHMFAKLNESLFDNFLDDDLIFKDVLHVEGDFEDEMFNQHIGYVNLFPLIMGFVPNENRRLLLKQIDLVAGIELNSNFGVRSLSQYDHLYYQNNAYWTGPIWIPINYIILSALNQFYIHDSADVLLILRQNLMENVFKVWLETGYLFEQYDGETGIGLRGKPFCGWSSLILLIQNYDFI